MDETKIIIPSIFGKDIGVIADGKNGLQFQYHKEFDADRYPISPISMPYDPEKVFNYYDNMSTNGLMGIFADSLPDSFGMFIMDAFFKKKYGHSSSHYKLSTLEKLSYIGDDGIGAIEYRPQNSSYNEVHIEFKEYFDEIQKVLSGSINDVLPEVLNGRSPAGGARPKVSALWDAKSSQISLAHTSAMRENGLEPYIFKFDEKGKEHTKIEYTYTQLARETGINVPDVSLVHVGDEVHFATKRFDRHVKNGDKYHQATLAGLTHRDFMSRSFSYEEYLRIAQALTHSPKAGEEAFRRMTFNVIGRNCDDHIKNFSFLMDSSGEWRLSPAYDLIHADGKATFGQHRMTINGKNDHISLADLARCGYSAGLEKQFMKSTIESIGDLFSEIEKKLLDNGVSQEVSKLIGRGVRPLGINEFPDDIRRKKYNQQ